MPLNEDEDPIKGKFSSIKISYHLSVLVLKLGIKGLLCKYLHSKLLPIKLRQIEAHKLFDFCLISLIKRINFQSLDSVVKTAAIIVLISDSCLIKL